MFSQPGSNSTFEMFLTINRSPLLSSLSSGNCEAVLSHPSQMMFCKSVLSSLSTRTCSLILAVVCIWLGTSKVVMSEPFRVRWSPGDRDGIMIMKSIICKQTWGRGRKRNANYVWEDVDWKMKREILFKPGRIEWSYHQCWRSGNGLDNSLHR